MILLALGCAAAEPPVAVHFDPTHAAYDALLSKNVRDGHVDYEALVRDRSGLDAVLANFAAPDRATVEGWSRDIQLAYWIDLYNAQTLRTVIDHWPVTSIRSIGLLPYSAFRERAFRIRARTEPLSLDDVEKDIVLAEWKEPRAHMALNCASKSCPALAGEPWSRAASEGRLDDALDAAARGFLADSTKNSWDPTTRTLGLSRIFDWYSADFGDVDAWIGRYGPPELVAAVAGQHRVEFREYDWALNGL